MNTAYVLLFPGQGAQKVGMGRDLIERYEPARQAFRDASEATGVDLQKACLEGPEAELARTDLCQPAIVTVSIATLRALEAEMGGPLTAAAAAGLSLGEYTALVAAQAIAFQDAVRLVYARGRFMQAACDASPGTMYSIIGLDDAKVEDACARAREGGGRVWPANYNCPGQVVISGEKEAAARAGTLCAEMGARRALPLNVAGAFHTPLMQPAADSLARELSKTEFRSPAFPVLSNVTGEPVCDPAQIRELLARQVTSPVRWAQSMRWCAVHGAQRFLEVGPGKVLQGLLKRVDAALNCTCVGNADELTLAASQLRR